MFSSTDKTSSKILRPIRSFVRREGRITPSQIRALKDWGPTYCIAEDSGRIDLDVLFSRSAPVWFEIGFGNGQSLAQLARSKPEINFIGADVYRPGMGSLIIQLAHDETTNVRIYGDDAVECLRDRISPSSLNQVLIFFPDPWPKKRHHKRRLIQVAFLQLLASRLTPGGRVHIATDWAEYAEHIIEVVTQQRELINLAGENRFIERPEYRPLTKFEQRGLKLGHEVFDILLEKPLTTAIADF